MSQPPVWEVPAPGALSAPPMWEDEEPPKAYLRQQPEPPGPPGRRTRTIVITLLVILLVAAGGSTLALKLRSNRGRVVAPPSRGAPSPGTPSPGAPSPGRPPGPSRGGPSRGATASHPHASPSQPTPQITQTPARTTPQTSVSSGPPLGHATVAVTSAAARDPAAASVASFLTSYFTAINAHDYQRFLHLLAQQLRQIETAQRFAAGFGSTTDSGAILIGLSATQGGRLAAIAGFISHQSPTDSPDHSACTRWTITLYLEPVAGTYLIGVPPAGYQASQQPC